MATRSELELPAQLLPLNQLCEAILKQGEDKILAIILVGSFARNEQTIFHGKILGDLDLIVITDRYRLILERRLVALAVKYSQDLHLKTQLGVVPLAAWMERQTLLFYEAREKGVVIYGDKALLSSQAVNEARCLPKWEGIRRLLNASLELLESNPFSEDDNDLKATYVKSKTCLACCEALLVFRGRYAPTYLTRSMILSDLYRSEYAALSSRIPGFADLVRTCTAWKLKPSEEEQRLVNAYSWFNVRDILLEVVRFCMMEYFHLTQLILDDIPDLLDTLPINRLRSILFLTKNLGTGNFPIVLLCDPVVKVWKAGIHLISSPRPNGELRREHLDQGAYELHKIVKLNMANMTTREKFSYLTHSACSSLQFAPQIVLGSHYHSFIAAILTSFRKPLKKSSHGNARESQVNVSFRTIA